MMLGSGQHAFSWNYTFPLNIPPSMKERDDTYTRYSVTAQIDMVEGKNSKIIAPLTIMNDDVLIYVPSSPTTYFYCNV